MNALYLAIHQNTPKLMPNHFFKNELDEQLKRQVAPQFQYQYQALMVMEKNVNKVRENMEIVRIFNPSSNENNDLKVLGLDPYGDNSGLQLQLNMWPFSVDTMRSPAADLGQIYNDNIDDVIKIIGQYQLLLLMASKYFIDPRLSSKLKKTDDGYHVTLGHYLAFVYDFEQIESCPITSPKGQPFVSDN